MSSSQPASPPNGPATSPPTTVIDFYHPERMRSSRWYELVLNIGLKLDGFSHDQAIPQATRHTDNLADAIIKPVVVPPELFVIIRRPTRDKDGAYKLHEMTADEVLAHLPISEVAWRERLVLIPPLNGDVDAYAEAIKRRTGEYPALAFSHEILYDSPVWHVEPYTLGMKNTHELVVGML